MEWRGGEKCRLNRGRRGSVPASKQGGQGACERMASIACIDTEMRMCMSPKLQISASVVFLGVWKRASMVCMLSR